MVQSRNTGWCNLETQDESLETHRSLSLLGITIGCGRRVLSTGTASGTAGRPSSASAGSSPQLGTDHPNRTFPAGSFHRSARSVARLGYLPLDSGFGGSGAPGATTAGEFVLFI
jgi:hypothetical protein